MAELNYDEIDANLHALVQALNELPSLHTIGSCGGHENPTRGQWDAGSWYVKFELDRDVMGWLTLEFLGWAINNDYRRMGRGDIRFLPTAPPPYMNDPFFCLSFVIEGYGGADPDALAEFLNSAHENLYTLPDADDLQAYYDKLCAIPEEAD